MQQQGPEWYAPPGAPGPGLDPSSQHDDGHAVVEPAGFWIRGGAHVIDIITATIVGGVSGFFAGIVAAVLGGAGVIAPGWEERIGKQSGGAFLFGMLAALAYHTFAEALAGATVGKAILGLRVITVDHRPCTFLKALGRNLAYYIDALFFGAVAWSAMSRSPMKQRNGDKWAGTIVVFSRSVPASARRSPVLGLLVALMAYSGMEVFSLLLKVF